MAKAHITTENGVKITIEGTPEEVSTLMKKMKTGRSKQNYFSAAKRISKNRAKATPMNLIDGLIDGGFFKKPQELSAIKIALQEQGHNYPVNRLSPALIRLVRKGQLKRKKDKKLWLYTN
ncbi:MAG: hypothetical protein WC675_03280 [Patescibacteria group bacterium]|jgi:hypothetical protein